MNVDVLQALPSRQELKMLLREILTFKCPHNGICNVLKVFILNSTLVPLGFISKAILFFKCLTKDRLQISFWLENLQIKKKLLVFTMKHCLLCCP